MKKLALVSFAIFLLIPISAYAELMCYNGFENGQEPRSRLRWWQVDDGLYPPDDWNDTSCINWAATEPDQEHYRRDVVGSENGITPRHGSYMAVMEVKEGASPVAADGSVGESYCCHRLGARVDENNAYGTWGCSKYDCPSGGGSMWYAWSIYLDSWPVPSPEWRLFSNLHTQDCDDRCENYTATKLEGTRKSTMAFQTRSGRTDIEVIVTYNSATCADGSWSEKTIYSTPASNWIGRWVDIVYQIRGDWDNDGWIKLWINDQLYDPDGDGYTDKGPNRYNDPCGPYLTIPAIYQSKKGSLPVRIYVDEIRVARGNGDVKYSDIAPSGGSTVRKMPTPGALRLEKK